jgi:hypothetical protein
MAERYEVVVTTTIDARGDLELPEQAVRDGELTNEARVVITKFARQLFAQQWGDLAAFVDLKIMVMGPRVEATLWDSDPSGDAANVNLSALDRFPQAKRLTQRTTKSNQGK